jgi:hypothetical protein
MLNPRQVLAFAPWRDVRFGSKADMCIAKGHVRFTPKSGHVQCNWGCPLCAKSGVRPFFIQDWVLVSITSVTHPVLGSIRLTAEAGPSEPYNRRSRIWRISSALCAGALIRCLLRAVPLNTCVGPAMPF